MYIFTCELSTFLCDWLDHMWIKIALSILSPGSSNTAACSHAVKYKEKEPS